MAGKLGAGICAYFLDRRFVTRIGGTRALRVTPEGAQALRDVFGIREWATPFAGTECEVAP